MTRGGGAFSLGDSVRTFVRREAVFSSRIEGTQSTPGELLAAEAGEAVKKARTIYGRQALPSSDSQPC
jgi:hypothetical protein